jgi:hypothetical protein
VRKGKKGVIKTTKNKVEKGERKFVSHGASSLD